VADIAIGNIALVTARGTLAGQQILSTFHYRCTSLGSSFGTPTQTAMAELIGAIVDPAISLHSRLIDVMPSNYTLNRWTAQVIQPVRYAEVKGTVLDTTGASGAIASTANIAAVITRRGVLGNRSNVGSLHLPYPDALTETTTGVISAAFLADLDLLAANMRQTLTLTPSTIVFAPVLYNKGKTPNYTDITASFAQSTIRVMRRRTVGVGR